MNDELSCTSLVTSAGGIAKVSNVSVSKHEKSFSSTLLTPKGGSS